MNNAVFGKAMENARKKDISNLSQQKEEEIAWCQTQVVTLKSFS